MSYSSWMFLCAECRVELAREKEQETRHVHRLERLEGTGDARLLTTAGRAP